MQPQEHQHSAAIGGMRDRLQGEDRLRGLPQEHRLEMRDRPPPAERPI